MQCKTLKKAVSDSRSKLGTSSTGIKQRFGQNVNRTHLSFDKENKTPSSVFMARHEAATFCLKSRDMAVSPLLVDSVRAVPEKCNVLREVAIQKHHQIIMPFVSDLVFNIEDAYDVIKSEIKNASPALQIMHDTSKDLVNVSKTTIGSVSKNVPYYIQKLQQKVARAYRSRQEEGEKEVRTAPKFDPAFVHACHECDNCKSFPIEGYRWRAVRPKRFGEKMNGNEEDTDFRKELTIPDTSKRNYVEMDYDLCHMCYMEWRALGCYTLDLPHGVKFYSAQLEDDRMAHLLRHNLPVPEKEDNIEKKNDTTIEEEQIVFVKEEVVDNSNVVADDECGDWTKTQKVNDNDVQSLSSDMSVAASEEVVSVEASDEDDDDEKSSTSPSDDSWNKMEESSSSSSSQGKDHEVISVSSSSSSAAASSDNEVIAETDEATERTSNKGIVDTTSLEDETIVVTVETKKEEAKEEKKVAVEDDDDEGCSSGEESEWSLMSDKSSSSNDIKSSAATTAAPTQTTTKSSGEDFYRWFMS